ncbi:MAG: hypothetical protein AB7G17_10770 [Phycisphaerales bacterium]
MAGAPLSRDFASSCAALTAPAGVLAGSLLECHRPSVSTRVFAL